MAYTKQNFKSKEKLYASQLNAMDDQILQNAQDIKQIPAVYYEAQTLTEAQKAQARANIGATAGEDVEFADSVEWLNEYGDTEKKYVLPDGYIYTYTQKTVTVEHNANDGTMTLNVRPKPKGTMTETTTNNGIAVTSAIEVDSSWTDCVVNISGLSELVENFYSTFYVFYYASDGSWNGYSGANHLGYSSTSQALPVSPDITTVATEGTWAQAKYVRIAVCVKGSGVSLANSDIANLVINFERLNTQKTETGWFSTGQQHSNDKATQQNSADIAALKERTETLETDVEELKNGNLVNISTGQVLYAVGDSITYGYGIGGNEYSWVKRVIDRNGYDAVNSLNLGQSGLGFCTTSTSSNTIQDVVGGTDFSGADIVTVALGINDWKNYNATLTDFWAGMEYCFNKIRTDNPYCKIFYILPFSYASPLSGSVFETFYALGAKGDSNTERPYGHTLQSFINMIKDKLEEETFKAFHVHVIDMVECAAINRHNINTALFDGLHPSAETNVELGKEIARRIALT